jgi:diphthamide biosynthesis protein 7
LIVSISSGSLAYIDLEDTDNEITEFSAHMYEPWITSFDSTDDTGRTVWSGGDDCVMKRWDLDDTSRPTFVNKQ